MKIWILGLAPALALLVGSCVLGQEEGSDVQAAESTMEMTVIGSDDGSPPMIFTTSGGAGAFFAEGMPMLAPSFKMSAPDPWQMVNNPSVQKDLELVGDQLQKVKELQNQHMEEIQKHFGTTKNGSIDLSNIENLKASMEKLKAQQQEELKKLLLPHQIERLQQIALQTHMKQAGTAGALGNEKVAKELGISDDQLKRLKEKSKELQEKLAKDIEDLKARMKNDLLSELTSEQREKLKAMTGDDYKPSSEDWRGQLKNPRGTSAPGRGASDGPASGFRIQRNSRSGGQ